MINRPSFITPSWAKLLGIALLLTGVKLLIFGVLTHGALASELCQWDCNWYLSIAEHGYDAAPHRVGDYWQANWAFFPLYPLLVRCVARIGGGFQNAGIIVSTAAFLAFAVFGARYRQATRGEVGPWPWLIFVTVWPYGFYFHAQYSEALYAMLATAGLLALARDRTISAGIAGAFLTAARPTGILLAAGIGLRQALLMRRARTSRALLRLALPVVLSVSGLLVFMAFLWVRVGDPLAFASIEQAWQHHAGNPIAVVASGFRDMSLAHRHVGKAYESAWALLGLAAALWLLIGRKFMEGWFCGATIVMALASGTLDSLPRYVAANPVFIFAAADLWGRIPWRSIRILTLVALAALQIVFVADWIRGATFLI